MSKHQTAAMLIIGNELLSGRTREANGWLAARELFHHGCKLAEIAIVPDVQTTIIESLNRQRSNHDAVITSGGIGPTHDDITMAAVSKAFGVPLVEHPATLVAMEKHYGASNLNPGRRRMAMLPRSAESIVSQASIAPGAHIGNVYVLAGVPNIFASQLGAILPHFGGKPWHRREIDVALPESSFARALALIQDECSEVEIGSYPHRCGQLAQGKICLSSQNIVQLKKAENRVRAMLESLTFRRGQN